MVRGSAASWLLAAVLVTFAGGGLVHCSSDSEDTACDPGRQISCACSNGMQGVQTCASDGTGWAKCMCEDASVGNDGGPDAATGAGGSATGTGGSTAAGGNGGSGGSGTGGSNGSDSSIESGVDAAAGTAGAAGAGGGSGAGGSGGGTSLDGSVACPAGSATNVTTGECDLVLQDCPGGHTCRVQSVDGGSPRAACVRYGDGPNDLGEACTSHSHCRAGLSCVLQKCSRPCCAEYEAAICGAGDCDITVNFPGGAYTRVCTFSPSCTPWTKDCPTGPETDCHLSGSELKCSFPRYDADAGSTIGMPCVYMNDCGDSQFCLYGSGATSGICRWLCKISASGAPDAGTVGGLPGQGGCETGESCIAFSSPSWLGVCRP